MTADQSGSAYITGWFEGTADLDPGPGTFNVTANGVNDAFLMKLDNAANFEWGIRVGDVLETNGSDLALDAQDNLYVVGCFQGTADFDPGPGTLFRSSAGDSDGFLWRLDNNGNLVWAATFGGADGERPREP